MLISRTGKQALLIAKPRFWNKLPESLHFAQSGHSQPKTYLFQTVNPKQSPIFWIFSDNSPIMVWFGFAEGGCLVQCNRSINRSY